MIETERLILRPFEDRDRAAFAAMNADPVVMADFPATLDRQTSDRVIDDRAVRLARDGFACGAVERRADGAFLGLCGLERADLGFGPCVEIAWRFAAAFWGQGYAAEAASAWLGHGFERLRLPEIVAFTATRNARSQALMRRLGMRPEPARDFDHPKIEPGHPLRRHVLYAITAGDWASGSAAP